MELLFHSRVPIHSKERRYTLAAIISTVGYTEKDEKPAKTEILMNIGYAICSEKDHFERKKGRMIAKGRAEKRPILQIAATGEFVKDICIFKQIFKEFPEKFRNKLVNPHKLKK